MDSKENRGGTPIMRRLLTIGGFLVIILGLAFGIGVGVLFYTDKVTADEQYATGLLSSAVIIPSDAPEIDRTMGSIYHLVFGDRCVVCDGAHDQVECNAVFDALPNGGLVHMREGNYNVSDTQDALKITSNIVLDGLGEVTIHGDGVYRIITNRDWQEGNENIIVRGINIEGHFTSGAKNKSGGLVYFCNVDNLLNENIIASQGYQHCFEYTGIRNSIIKNCWGIDPQSDDCFSFSDGYNAPGGVVGASTTDNVKVLDCGGIQKGGGACFEFDDGVKNIRCERNKAKGILSQPNSYGFHIHVHDYEVSPQHITLSQCSAEKIGFPYVVQTSCANPIGYVTDVNLLYCDAVDTLSSTSLYARSVNDLSIIGGDYFKGFSIGLYNILPGQCGVLRIEGVNIRGLNNLIRQGIEIIDYYSVFVSNNRIWNHGGGGVIVWSKDYDVYDYHFHNNTIDGCGSTGIESYGLHFLDYGHRITDVSGTSNHIGNFDCYYQDYAYAFTPSVPENLQRVMMVNNNFHGNDIGANKTNENVQPELYQIIVKDNIE